MDISQLIGELDSAEITLRRNAAERLALAPDAAAAVSLARASGDDDEQVREWAVAALEELGAPDADDVAALGELLTDGRPDVRYWAATLLGRVGEPAAQVVGALSCVLDADPEAAVRQRAVWAIGQMGGAAVSARHALHLATQNGDARLARLAREALAKLGDD
jgi:HEAT repeat protein